MARELDRLQLYHYTLDRILGQGGTGKVYRGIDQNTGDVVAVKLFFQNFFRNRQHIRSLEKSVKRFKNFDHRNVVKIIDLLNGEEGVCLIQEYVDGPDLKWYIPNRPWNLQERLVVVVQILNGLQYIHDQGFTHHDLKPGNVLFNRKGLVKLADYSLSPTRQFWLLDAGLSEQLTPMYVAPELIKKKKATPQSDIYSLGITLYLMFTEKHPFEVDRLDMLYACHLNVMPEHPSTVNHKCPPALGDIIMRMLAKEPSKRFDTCDQLRISLSDVGRSRI